MTNVSLFIIVVFEHENFGAKVYPINKSWE